jgi:hypothetical protein
MKRGGTRSIGRRGACNYPEELFWPSTIVLRKSRTGAMINPLVMLAVESNGVIALRMMKLMLGGSGALDEVHLMVSEKVDAALEATANLMAGASGEDVIRRYRQHVAANVVRLRVKRDVPS